MRAPITRVLIFVAVLSGCMSLNSVTAVPAQSYARPSISAGQKPGFISMAVDLVVARPVMMALTVAGTGVFIASLPFTTISHSVKSARETLIEDPARSAFKRCLGCSH